MKRTSSTKVRYTKVQALNTRFGPISQKINHPCNFRFKLLPTISAIELDKEPNADAIRAEFGNGIWIRGQFIAGFNELNNLDKRGELDTMLENVPKTTYTTPR